MVLTPSNTVSAYFRFWGVLEVAAGEVSDLFFLSTPDGALEKLFTMIKR